MSRILDVNLRQEDLALQVGQLVLQLWAGNRKIQVLESRVDELDAPDPEPAPEVLPHEEDDPPPEGL